MTAPTPLDQDDLAARAAAAGVPVELDAEAAYATIGGRVYRARLERVCACPPCPGRGNDGHGLTHCAECCFGTGVEADPDCPIHGIRTVEAVEES